MDDYIRKLIYEDRQSIRDFDIDVKYSLENLLFEKYLPATPEMKISQQGFNSRALEAFNDAYYVCTTMLSQTNSILELSYYIERIQYPSVVLPMVHTYLTHLNSDNSIVKRNIALIVGAVKTESDWESNFNIITSLNKEIGRCKLDQSMFSLRKLTQELLEEINWYSITNKFDKNKILKIASNICRNEKDWRMVIEAIKNAAKEYEWNYNNELFSGDYFDDEIGKWCYYEDKPIDLSSVYQYCDEIKEKFDLYSVSNTFAPTIHLENLLCQDWFDEICSDSKLYTKAWREKMVDALMINYGSYIAANWKKDRKIPTIKMSLIGALNDVGILNGSYSSLSKRINHNKSKKAIESCAKYMGYGKKEPYFEWLKSYVEQDKQSKSD